MKYTFSGHESFQCRHLWLKKGYEFVKRGGSFTDGNAVVELGVGKNMVASIRFWMRACDLLNQNEELTPIAKHLLDDQGWDPYLEDEASLWLLHYHLVSKSMASTYYLVFNEFRREKMEFNKEHYIAFLKRKAESTGGFQINERTLQEDFSVMTKNYIRSQNQTKDKEDTFSGLFTELDIVKSYGRGKDDIYVIENTEKPEIPDEVILYSILLSNDNKSSIDLDTIERGINNPGVVFAINRIGLLNKIEGLSKKHSHIVFSDHAGIRELQLKKELKPFDILQSYYESNI